MISFVDQWIFQSITKLGRKKRTISYVTARFEDGNIIDGYKWHTLNDEKSTTMNKNGMSMDKNQSGQIEAITSHCNSSYLNSNSLFIFPYMFSK